MSAVAPDHDKLLRLAQLAFIARAALTTQKDATP